MRYVEESGELQAQIRIALKLRRRVGEQAPLFQCRDQALQADGVSQPQKIQPADAEGKAWAESGSSSRRIQRRHTAADTPDLRAKPDIDRVAAGLFERIQDIF